MNSSSAEGILDFSKPAKLKYRFEKAPVILSPSSLEIEYSLNVPLSGENDSDYQVIFELSGDSWALPLDISFLEGLGGVSAAASVFHYAIPLRRPLTDEFSIYLPAAGSNVRKNRQERDDLPRFRIHSLEIKERWYGFYGEQAESSMHIFVSPFVYTRNANSLVNYVIDPPGEQWPAVLALVFPPGSISSVNAEGRRFEISAKAGNFFLPGGVISANHGPVELSGTAIDSFQLRYEATAPFPVPITADPGLILAWPRENWRDSRYEVFRWENFPSLLVFDTASYDEQDRLFKRLAFFTEKAGFRGRLAPDSEIAGLHGWNAHDYRAEDLARFFEIARRENFPLLKEEQELRLILLDAGIIRRSDDGAITGGNGGLISISRESENYLRSLFMAHEGFHGLFFIDEDFRTFSSNRWLELPRQARNFITSYFDFKHYDISDNYLMVNEFMAHLLQQPSFRAGVYFGETLPQRLESSPRRIGVLEGKDPETGSWPYYAEIFTKEAQAFSAYVDRRWGLSGGRVWRITVSQ